MKFKITLIAFNIFSIIFFSVYFHFFTPKREVSSLNVKSVKTLEVDFKKFIQDYEYLPSLTNEFSLLEISQQENFKSTIDLILKKNYEKATELASSFQYEIYEVTDVAFSNSIYICLMPYKNNSLHQGIFCINENAKFNHHIAAPHPIIDSNSNIISVDIFRKNSFKFFSVASAHRCASEIKSSCTGETSVCGKKGPYPISDLAHNSQNFFHDFSIYVFENFQDSISIQLHGCGGKVCPFGTDNDVVARISVGTKDILNETAISNKLSAILDKKLKKIKNGASSRSCNQIGEVDYSLCATANVQGRYMNGERENPCNKTPVALNESRFLHIETNNDLRKDIGKGDAFNPEILIESIAEMLK